jgi:hypothetical protein
VAALAAELAQSFAFSRERFEASYPALLASDGACLLLAVSGPEPAGYLLGFRHLTFYANGPVAWVSRRSSCAARTAATASAGPWVRLSGYGGHRWPGHPAS